MTYEIVPAQISHLLPLAANMREADRREVWASHRLTPYEALSTSLKTSERAWVALVEGQPIIIWGVARDGSIYSSQGVPWMLATNELEQKYWLSFLKESRHQVLNMMDGFERLENFVHGGNKLSIKWLKWCGFHMSQAPIDFNGEDFYQFWRDAKCVA